MIGAVFVIDGTPFGGYVEGVAFAHLTIDMVNMADISTNVAINQVQAYDLSYDHVRVIHDGASKRAWLFSTGAYTTTLKDTQGNILECAGTSTANGATTITALNHDGGSVISNYCNSLRFVGGAYQGVGNTKFKFRNGTDYQIETDVEGTGIYLNVDNTVNFLRTYAELQGFSGTYMVGSPAPSSILLDQQTNYNTYPFRLTTGLFNFNNQGVAGVSSLFSGAEGSNYELILGRTGNDTLLAVAAAANDILPGTIAGDSVLTALGGGRNLFLGGGDVPQAKITTTGFNTYGNGTLSQGIVNVRPSTDTDSLTVQNSAGAYLFDLNTQSAPLAEFVNGTALIGYTGAFSGQTWKVATSTGVASYQGEIVQPAGDNSSVFQVNNAAASKNVFSVSTGGTTPGVYVNATLLLAASPPTYTGGFSAGTPTIVGATSAAFTVALGTAPGSTGTLAMPAAATGWNCLGQDRTTAAGTIRETAATTNGVTFALSNTAAGDILQLDCVGY